MYIAHPWCAYLRSVCTGEQRVQKRQRGTAVETESESKWVCACVSLYQSTHSIQIQPKRVVSVTTIVGNMIFHYTLCKQCNLSVLSIKMIDCGLSQDKSDMPGKKSFFLTKHGAFRLPQKVVINVFSLGNPTPLANEGGIYHLHCGGRCREDSNPSAWEQFTFFSLIVPEKCDRFGEKHLSRQLLGASTTTHNDRHFKNTNQPFSTWKYHLLCTGKHWKIRGAIRQFSAATVSLIILARCCLKWSGRQRKKQTTKINNECTVFHCVN